MSMVFYIQQSKYILSFELAKMRDKLITPIQDDIYEAVKAISQQYGYDLVVDRASATGIIFANPRIDISDEILRKLGYSN